jgi:Zn-dependent M28 family amino/carboxypeptidase
VSNLAVVVVLALLQSAPAVSSQNLVPDVARLAAGRSNDERFEALTSMLRERKLPFSVERFTIEKERGKEPRTEGRNIVVTAGSGPEVVIGAHYDAARLRDGSLSTGAVDNGASSIILVRLAEMIRAQPLAMRTTFVWFDMEELGLIGSARYLQSHANDGISAMINLDINASGDTMLFGPSAAKEAVALRRQVLETCAAETIDCVAFPQMPPGDDRSFSSKGIPTVSLALVPAIEAHQLWLLVNGNVGPDVAKVLTPPTLATIHTPEDTIAKVTEDGMARVLRFTAALLKTIGTK